MTTFPADTDPGIESQLIDLTAVPFAVLRDLDGEVIHNAMRYVVERAGQVRITSRSGNSAGGGERID
jgi:hypothetical protein